MLTLPVVIVGALVIRWTGWAWVDSIIAVALGLWDGDGEPVWTFHADEGRRMLRPGDTFEQLMSGAPPAGPGARPRSGCIT